MRSEVLSTQRLPIQPMGMRCTLDSGMRWLVFAVIWVVGGWQRWRMPYEYEPMAADSFIEVWRGVVTDLSTDYPERRLRVRGDGTLVDSIGGHVERRQLTSAQLADFVKVLGVAGFLEMDDCSPSVDHPGLITEIEAKLPDGENFVEGYCTADLGDALFELAARAEN